LKPAYKSIFSTYILGSIGITRGLRLGRCIFFVERRPDFGRTSKVHPLDLHGRLY
jgi:hypothetical protein